MSLHPSAMWSALVARSSRHDAYSYSNAVKSPRKLPADHQMAASNVHPSATYRPTLFATTSSSSTLAERADSSSSSTSTDAGPGRSGPLPSRPTRQQYQKGGTPTRPPEGDRRGPESTSDTATAQLPHSSVPGLSLVPPQSSFSRPSSARVSGSGGPLECTESVTSPTVGQCPAASGGETGAQSSGHLSWQPTAALNDGALQQSVAQTFPAHQSAFSVPHFSGFAVPAQSVTETAPERSRLWSRVVKQWAQRQPHGQPDQQLRDRAGALNEITASESDEKPKVSASPVVRSVAQTRLESCVATSRTRTRPTIAATTTTSASTPRLYRPFDTAPHSAFSASAEATQTTTSEGGENAATAAASATDTVAVQLPEQPNELPSSSRPDVQLNARPQQMQAPVTAATQRQCSDTEPLCASNEARNASGNECERKPSWYIAPGAGFVSKLNRHASEFVPAALRTTTAASSGSASGTNSSNSKLAAGSRSSSGSAAAAAIAADGHSAQSPITTTTGTGAGSVTCSGPTGQTSIRANHQSSPEADVQAAPAPTPAPTPISYDWQTKYVHANSEQSSPTLPSIAYSYSRVPPRQCGPATPTRSGLEGRGAHAPPIMMPITKGASPYLSLPYRTLTRIRRDDSTISSTSTSSVTSASRHIMPLLQSPCALAPNLKPAPATSHSTRPASTQTQDLPVQSPSAPSFSQSSSSETLAGNSNKWTAGATNDRHTETEPTVEGRAEADADSVQSQTQSQTQSRAQAEATAQGPTATPGTAAKQRERTEQRASSESSTNNARSSQSQKSTGPDWTSERMPLNQNHSTNPTKREKDAPEGVLFRLRLRQVNRAEALHYIIRRNITHKYCTLNAQCCVRLAIGCMCLSL